ncbi:MAG: SPOR domain-containing protein [Desulfuromonadaceae bacterium]|nr:SPOR domain-containing protein [Desulfuromonadaceae bacterium]MDD4130571.1 SPOR domain-containing protein [Desulfuromonadaceae bacterium]
MDIKFSKDSGNSQQQEVPGEKKNQNALLVLLLVLVSGFTYIYFFTDLIKPQEAPKTAELPAPAPQVVKIPLPARDGSPVGPCVKTPEKTETTKAAATATTTTTTAASAAKPAVPAKPAQAPAAKPAAPIKPVPAPAAKTAPTPTNAKELPKKAPATKTVDKKSAEAAKKSLPVKEARNKPVSGNQVKPQTTVKGKMPTTGPWSILVGNYVLEEALSVDMGRVRKAGFKPAIKPAARKKTAMSRLFISEHSDRGMAQSTLEKLNRYTSDAFVLEQSGKFAVYAGSYLQKGAANSEKERLKAAGFTVTVKHADIAIPTQNLSVGPFKNKKEAENALGRLKRAGIKATLTQQ